MSEESKFITRDHADPTQLAVSVTSQSLSGQADAWEKVRGQALSGETFTSATELVKKQIEFDCFSEEEKGQAMELCRIVAEVMTLPPNLSVRIDGKDIPAALAAEVFGELTHEHLSAVMENYKNAVYRICRRKTYLRTALYNSVFELESGFVNSVNEILQSN